MMRALLIVSLLWPSAALASGFGLVRFGGARANPTSPGPTAVYFNPAALAQGEGTRILADVNYVFRRARYLRDPTAIDDLDQYADRDAAAAASSGEATLDDFLISPMAGVSTDFGTPDLPLRAGLAVLAPFGGLAEWDSAPESALFPGAVDGPQRWHLIEGSLRTLGLVTAASWRFEGTRLSVGLSGSLYLTSLSVVRARNPDGTDHLTTRSGTLKEGRFLIEGTSLDFGMGAGLLWEAIPGSLWLGASWQSAPNFTGLIELDGAFRSAFANAPAEGERASVFRTKLPDVVRWGARWAVSDRWTVRLHGDWTRWSVMDRQCLLLADAPDPDQACATSSTGAQSAPALDDGLVQIIQRRWRDTFSVQAHGGFSVLPDLELQAGAGYESGATRKRTLDATVIDGHTLSVALGAAWRIAPWIAVALEARNLHFLERDTTGHSSHTGFASPSRQPSSAGRYNQNIVVVNSAVELHF